MAPVRHVSARRVQTTSSRRRARPMTCTFSNRSPMLDLVVSSCCLDLSVNILIGDRSSLLQPISSWQLPAFGLRQAAVRKAIEDIFFNGKPNGSINSFAGQATLDKLSPSLVSTRDVDPLHPLIPSSQANEGRIEDTRYERSGQFSFRVLHSGSNCTQTRRLMNRGAPVRFDLRPQRLEEPAMLRGVTWQS